MTDKRTWQRFEQRVAAFFKTTRTPMSGGNSKFTRSDSLHPRLFISCKLKAKSAIHSLFREEEVKAAKEGKTCVLALQDKHYPGWLLVCRPQDIHLLASLAKDCDILPGFTDGTAAATEGQP